MQSHTFFSILVQVMDQVNKDYTFKLNAGTLDNLTKQRLLVTKLLYTYVMSCFWNPTTKTKQFMATIHMSDSKAAEELNISRSTVRSRRSQYSQKLYGMLGNDIFAIIQHGSFQQLNALGYHLRYLCFGYKNVGGFIPQNILSELMVSENTNDSFELSECVKQLYHLALFDKHYANRMVDNMSDQERAKMNYLLSVLAGLRGDSQLKERIVVSMLKAEDNLANFARKTTERS